MRINRTILTAVFVITILVLGCNTPQKEQQAEQKETKHKKQKEEESLYQKELSQNKVKAKKAFVVKYKFGEPSNEKLKLYETTYNKDGFLIDSITYTKNKMYAREKFAYNENNKIVQRELYDSLNRLTSKLIREFDQQGNDISFKAFRFDTLRYSQKKAYDKNNNLIKITDYYNDGSIKSISKYSYNTNNKVTSIVEMNDLGKILYKQTIGYDSLGRKINETDYDSTGTCVGKTLIKNYDKNDKIQLIEKYNAGDSLYARYEFEYNDKGLETKNTIYNGINQVLRQSITTYDKDGNRTAFKIYEGSVGLLGADEYTYNQAGKEIETKVLDGKGNLVTKVVKEYNEKGLLVKEINYNKLDEPQFEFVYEYEYFE